MKTIIHVNRHNIAANGKDGGSRPVFTVKDYRRNRKGSAVDIHGPCRFVYSPDKPLKCGAKAWVETLSKVSVLEPRDSGLDEWTV